MRETWLKSNRRILCVCCCAFALLATTGLVLALFGGLVVRWSGVLIAVVSFLGLLNCLQAMRQPRLAFTQGWLLVRVTGGAPIQVPIEIVECFFLGQATAGIAAEGDKEVETSTVVVRLAEAAKDWHERKTKPALGRWCGGYIILHGTWCEPLTPDLLRQMNHRLAEIHRERKRAS